MSISSYAVTDEAVNFLKQFVARPHEIGAIVPSSETLAREMVERVDWARVDVVVEYGPGLGAVTSEILRKADGRDFFVIEVNEPYTHALRRRFPLLPVYLGSAASIVEIAAAHGVTQVDCVISSLPWANFPEVVQNQILDAMFDVMAPHGQFATFAYMHGLPLPSGRRFRAKLEQRFRRVTRSGVIWRNAPPAIVYHCER